MVGSMRSFPFPCAFAHPHANMLAHAQTLAHVHERAGSLFADQIRRPAPSHNNTAMTRWPASSRARVGSRLQWRGLILTSIFCIQFYLYFENLIHQKIDYLGEKKKKHSPDFFLISQFRVWTFLCQSNYKCAKINGSKLVTQKNGWVLFHPGLCSSSCVDCTLWASLSGFHCVPFSLGWVEPAASRAHTENGLFCSISHVTRPFCCGCSYSESLNHINEKHLCWGQPVAFHRCVPRSCEGQTKWPTLTWSGPGPRSNGTFMDALKVPALRSCLFCGCCLFKKAIKPQRFIWLLI